MYRTSENVSRKVFFFFINQPKIFWILQHCKYFGEVKVSKIAEALSDFSRNVGKYGPE